MSQLRFDAVRRWVPPAREGDWQTDQQLAGVAMWAPKD